MRKRIDHSKAFFVKHRDLWVCLFLVIATLSVYWPVTNYEFVNIDDTTFVTENRHVQAGITYEGIKYTFVKYGTPLSILSHMLDCELFGLNSGGHHLTSLVLHVANTVLLYLVLNLMTGAPWKSAFVAALFAIHPLNVESVAWVAERRNVLSTLFWFLTMAAYIWYIRRPGFLRYMAVLLCFILGLMAKPMLVTLPFALLLLDYWPLGRFRYRSEKRTDQVKDDESRLMRTHPSILPVRRLIVEKVPLIAVSIVASLCTLAITKSPSVEGIGGLVSLEKLPIKFRIANALVSYVSYMVKMVYPKGLAVYYPYLKIFPIWKVALASLLLGCITFFALKALGRYPWFFVGWFWYLGTLVPVIQLVQLGAYRMADRYAYVPLIGLFIIIVWGVPVLVTKWRHGKTFLAISSALLFSIFLTVTWRQVGYWRNSITLFEHTLEVTSENYLAHYNLGTSLAGQGRIDEAIYHYSEALNIAPNYLKAHNNLGVLLSRQGRVEEAISHYLKALQIRSDYAEAHNNLGNALSKQGRIDVAIRHYDKALQIKPDFAEAHNNIGNALSRQGRIDEAIGHYDKALQIKPDFAEAHKNVGSALSKQGRIDEAIGHYDKALQIKPDYATAHNNLGKALNKQGRIDEAISYYLEALKIKPDYAEAHYNIGVALSKRGIIEKASHHYLEALEIKPDYVEAHYNLGTALTKLGRIDEAIEHYQAALHLKPDYVDAHNNLGIALYRKGDIGGAIAHFREALRINPEYVHAKNNLKRALMSQQRRQ